MKKTGILVAMPREWAPIEKKAEIASVTDVFGKKVYKGTFCGQPFAACVSGIGKVAAAVGVAALNEAFRPDTVINVGVAGGLGAVRCNTAAVAGKVWQHDFDTTAAGDEPGLYTGECDEKLSAELLSATGGVRADVATGDVFVADAAKAARIARTFSVSVCEMECAGALAMANALGIPFAAVKYISDGAEDSAADSYRVTLDSLMERAADDLERYFSSLRGKQ